MKNKLSRRSFVKQVGAAGITISLGGLTLKAAETKSSSDTSAVKIRNFKPTMAYREIGTTGVYVSVFSLGTGNVKPDVLSAAIDKGVNFIHTSFHYMNGQSLEMVGKAIKGKTEKVYIALKDDFPSIEEALKVLGVPSVDFLLFNRHNAEDLKKSSLPSRTSSRPGAARGSLNSPVLRSIRTLPPCSTFPPTPGSLPASCPPIRPSKLKNSPRSAQNFTLKKFPCLS